MACLGLIPGAVTPLGLLNDPEHRVRFYLDTEFLGNRIGVHPCDNTAIVWLQAEDLMRLIREHGNRSGLGHVIKRKEIAWKNGKSAFSSIWKRREKRA